MLINVFLSLFAMGIMSFLYQGIRLQKFLTVGFLCALAFLSFDFGMHFYSGYTDSFSYNWLSSKYYPVNIDFFSTFQNYCGTAAFLLVSVIAVIFILFDRPELQKLHLCALVSLNLAFLFMMVTAQNTIQLLVSACFIDVLGFCFMNQPDAGRRYIFYNLLADMALFMAFAMLWGSCSTNTFNEINICLQSKNIPLISIIAAASAIKSGLFPFHGYFMQIVRLTSIRQNILAFLSTPVSGFIILYKCYGFFEDMSFVYPFLYWMSLLSIIWGIIGAVLIKDFLRKKLYLNLMFYGIVFYAFLSGADNLVLILSALLGINFILFGCLYPTRRYFILLLFVCLAGVAALLNIILSLPEGYPVYACAAGLILCYAKILPEIYAADKENGNKWILWLGLFLLSGILYFQGMNYKQTVPWLAGYGILLLLPLNRLNAVYRSSLIQEADGFSELYRLVIVEPLYLLGRILWLTIDFIIIERTVLNSVSRLNNLLAKLFGATVFYPVLNQILLLVLCFAVVAAAYYMGK